MLCCNCIYNLKTLLAEVNNFIMDSLGSVIFKLCGWYIFQLLKLLKIVSLYHLRRHLYVKTDITFFIEYQNEDERLAEMCFLWSLRYYFFSSRLIKMNKG